MQEKKKKAANTKKVVENVVAACTIASASKKDNSKKKSKDKVNEVVDPANLAAREDSNVRTDDDDLDFRTQEDGNNADALLPITPQKAMQPKNINKTNDKVDVVDIHAEVDTKLRDVEEMDLMEKGDEGDSDMEGFEMDIYNNAVRPWLN
jgi:hypothetical protein